MIATPFGVQNTAYKLSQYFRQYFDQDTALLYFLGEGRVLFCFIFVKFGVWYLKNSRGAYIIIYKYFEVRYEGTIEFFKGRKKHRLSRTREIESGSARIFVKKA